MQLNTILRKFSVGLFSFRRDFVAIIPSGVAVGRRSMLDPCWRPVFKSWLCLLWAQNILFNLLEFIFPFWKMGVIITTHQELWHIWVTFYSEVCPVFPSFLPHNALQTQEYLLCRMICGDHCEGLEEAPLAFQLVPFQGWFAHCSDGSVPSCAGWRDGVNSTRGGRRCHLESEKIKRVCNKAPVV